VLYDQIFAAAFGELNNEMCTTSQVEVNISSSDFRREPKYRYCGEPTLGVFHSHFALFVL